MKKRSPFSPIRKAELEGLNSLAAREANAFQANMYRDSGGNQDLKRRGHYQRWFRILTDDEYADAAAAGDVFTSGGTNTMAKRTTPGCDAQPAQEADYSMWGVVVVKKCDHQYVDRPKEYELIRFPGIKNASEASELNVSLKNNKVAAFFNQDTSRWEAIGGGGESDNEGAGEMDFINICVNVPNASCVMDAVVMKYLVDETTDPCQVKVCQTPAWVTCINKQVTAGSAVGELSDYCGWAKHSGDTVTVSGDARALYLVPCNCAKECPPHPGGIVHGKFTNTDPECTQWNVDFEMKCVLQNPISLSEPAAGLTGWWGEFELAGKLPGMGTCFNIEGTVLGSDIVYVVYTGGDALCNGSNYRVYVETVDGFVDITGTPIVIEDPCGGGATLITGPDDCMLFFDNIFRYGVYGECNTNSPGFTGITLYHLLRGAGSSGGITDDCFAPGGTRVPVQDDRLVDGQEGTLRAQDACQRLAVAAFPPFFGNAFTCNIQIPGDGGPLQPIAPHAHHVLGGCPCWYKRYRSLPGICNCPNPTEPAAPLPKITLRWGPELCD